MSAWAELIVKSMVARGIPEKEIINYLWRLFNTADFTQTILELLEG